jgi:hypothetical protein
MPGKLFHAVEDLWIKVCNYLILMWNSEFAAEFCLPLGLQSSRMGAGCAGKRGQARPMTLGQLRGPCGGK